MGEFVPAFVRRPLPTLLGALLFVSAAAAQTEPVVTVLSDFEENDIVASLSEMRGTIAPDCSVRFIPNPARGLTSLSVTLATTAEASAVCNLGFQFASPFSQVDRIATQVWITEGDAQVAFRFRDAAGVVFESPLVGTRLRKRWARLAAEFKDFRPLGDANAGKSPVFPIEVEAYRITTPTIGRQTVILDDLQVEHAAIRRGSVDIRFTFDHPTRLYSPGETVQAHFTVENKSHKRAMPQVEVVLTWRRADGSQAATSRHNLTLPASREDYRSRQAVDVSQRFAEAGLYRLVASVREASWPNAAEAETTVAVVENNRTASRGRSLLFAARSNLMREPLRDQLLEIELAREIGVHLLALELPWRAIESRPGYPDLEALVPLVDLVATRDLALMLIVMDPPDAATRDTAALEAGQLNLIESITRRFGPKARFVQPWLPPDGAESLARMRQKLAALAGSPTLVAAPVDVRTLKGAKAPPEPSADAPLVFWADGDSADSLREFTAFQKQTGVRWTANHWWLHVAQPQAGPGGFFEATEVLRQYVAAARAGVGVLMWGDLRDDTNDPRRADQMRGLVRRDFSPKSQLLGYSNAVGMLAGLIYAGEVANTPAEYDSALFAAGERQVAVLMPRPNRVLPAVIAPSALVPGTIEAFSFERRPLTPLTESPMLLHSLTRPFFVRLTAAAFLDKPQLGLSRPWLRMPAEIALSESATLEVEIDVAPTANLRYAQLVLPQRSPVTSTFSAKDLRSEAGKTARIAIELKCAKPPLAQPLEAILRISSADGNTDIPFTIRPLAQLAAAAGTDDVLKSAPLAVLRAGSDERSPQTPLRGGASGDRLRLALEIPDNADDLTTWRIGVAAEGADQHVEADIRGLLTKPVIAPAAGFDAALTQGWKIERVAPRSGGKPQAVLEIPLAALRADLPAAPARLLTASRVVYEVQVGKPTPPTLRWGGGLEGDRRSVDFEWVALPPSKP
ncbi:MAG: hypothetical protein AMXMBFR47_05010 [Planctomycetota bacterium]